MWQYALWGLAGAAINRALLFLEASQRAKGWPWRFPFGPGAAPFCVATLLHLGIATVVTAAAAEAGYVPNALIAIGIGAAAPVVVKKMAGYTLSVLPRGQEETEGKDAP
jgi:hypothetical protein